MKETINRATRTFTTMREDVVVQQSSVTIRETINTMIGMLCMVRDDVAW